MLILQPTPTASTNSSALPCTLPATPPCTPPVTPATPPPSDIPGSDLSTLQSRGYALFRLILDLVIAVFSALVQRFSSDPQFDCLKTLSAVCEILHLIVKLQITIEDAPRRVTPLQLVRLAAAAGLLTRLTGRSFDFSPWLSLTSSQLAALESAPASPRDRATPNVAGAVPSAVPVASPNSVQSAQSPRPIPVTRPLSCQFPRIATQYPRPNLRSACPAFRNDPRSFRNPHAATRIQSIRNPQTAIRNRTSRVASLADTCRITIHHLPNPGTTLVRIIKKLVRILPPDFTPDAIESISSIEPIESIESIGSISSDASHATHTSHASHSSHSSYSPIITFRRALPTSATSTADTPGSVARTSSRLPP